MSDSNDSLFPKYWSFSGSKPPPNILCLKYCKLW